MSAKLSPRESQVLIALASSKNTKEIAAEWHRSEKTVEYFSRHMRDKLGLRDIAAVTRYAIANGMIQL